eukprot:SAG31_NODE_663_length_13021_cov_9.408296_12_plen_136_part_00
MNFTLTQVTFRNKAPWCSKRRAAKQTSQKIYFTTVHVPTSISTTNLAETTTYQRISYLTAAEKLLIMGRSIHGVFRPSLCFCIELIPYPSTRGRQVYITEVRDGKTASITPAPTEIERNFVISNYHGHEAIDNDE